jgi:hypothetical protein
MAVYSGSWLDRVVVQTQAASAPRTFNNASGTWTNTGSAIPRHINLTLTQNKPVVPTPYKTGTRSTLVGLAGRRSGTFSFTGPLVPSGTAGTAPDCDPLLQGVFGSAATIVAATSATYTFTDSGFIPFGFFRYNKSGGSSPTNFYALGCTAQRYTINLGGEYLTHTIEGKCVAIGDSQQFSSYTGVDLVAAGGLTTYPAEPGVIATNGNPINGFGGTATFDGNVQLELRGTPTITIATGLDMADDGFSDGYPFAMTGGRRQVSGSFRFADDDTSALNNIKVKAFTKQAMTISLAVNTTAGSIVTITMKNVQLGPYSLTENGNLFDIVLGESLAHATTASVVDDVTLAFT